MKKYVLILIFIMFIFFVGIWEVFLSAIVPQDRTYFANYSSFRKQVGGIADYTEQLPKSSDKLEYYWNVEWFVYKSGYRVVLSEEEYATMKQERREHWRDRTADIEDGSHIDWYVYDSPNKYIDTVQMKKNGVDYIDKLVLRPENMEDYYYLAYDIFGSDLRYYQGVICNDKTKEIIEFNYLNRNNKE